ncbi:MAG: hypothetical protein HY962_14810 [Ignavibacteriae bacterium]|nr:hypothetical protein [Ignavibacteriota bacterium]
MTSADTTAGLEKILTTLEALNHRVAEVEQRLHVTADGDTSVSAIPVERETEDEDRLEFRIGQFWLARAGIVMLITGCVFLLTLPYGTSATALPSLIGTVISATLYGLARIWRTSLRQFAGYLLGGALAVFYFSVLRLGHFTPVPLVSSTVVEVILLLGASTLCLYLAWRSESVYLTALSLGFGYVTAIVSDVPYVQLPLILCTAVLSVWISTRRWMTLIWFPAMCTYGAHFMWFLGNPVMGHPLQLVTGAETNLIFALAYIVVFAVGTLWARKEEDGSEMLFATAFSFMNAAMGFGMFVIIVELGAAVGKAPLYLAASIVLLGLAVMFWVRRRSMYSTFHYAMSGFIAMSCGIIHAEPVPDLFLWLALQGILVLSVAVWFRSRIIVVANYIIFVMMFVGYLIVAEGVTGIGMVFGITALLSARILNWQRDRLELRTDVMRGSYLVAGAVIIPLSLYSMLPAQYVAMSWLCVAAAYYGLSKVLRNKKYRVMALATLLATVAYVLLFTMSGVSIEYRVLLFVLVGLVLLVISALYFRAAQNSNHSMDTTARPDA